MDSQLGSDLPNFAHIKNERVSGVTREDLAPTTQFKQDEEDDDDRDLPPPVSTAEVVDLDTDDDSDEE